MGIKDKEMDKSSMSDKVVETSDSEGNGGTDWKKVPWMTIPQWQAADQYISQGTGHGAAAGYRRSL